MITFLRNSIIRSSSAIKVSASLALSLSIASSFQLFYLILRTALQTDSNRAYTLYSGIRSLTALCSDIEAYIAASAINRSLQIVWGMLAGYLVVHIGALVTFIIFQHLIPLEKGRSYKELLQRVSLAHSRVLFFIIHYFLVGVVAQFQNCKPEDQFPFYCRREYLILTIFLICINIGLAALKECFMYQVNNRSKDAYAVKENSYNQVILLHKGLITVVYFLTKNQRYSVAILAIANVLLSGISVALLYTKCPFYNIVVLKSSMISSGVALAFSLFHGVSLTELNQSWLDFVWLILTALLIKTLLVVFNKLVDRVRHGVIKSPEEALLFITLMKQAQFGYLPNTLFATKADRNIIIANGLFVNQKTSFSSLANLEQAENKKHYKALIYTYVLERMSGLARKNPDSKLLLLSMADICLTKLENIPKAMEYIRQLECHSLPIYIKSSLNELNYYFKQNQAIKYHSNTNTDYNLRLVKYFECREVTGLLIGNIKRELDKHLEFWNEMQRGAIDIKKALDIACEIDVLSSRTKLQWKKQDQSLVHGFVNSLLIYSAYLDLIKELLCSSRKLITRYWDSRSHKYNLSHLFDTTSKETAILILSTQRTSLGTIIDTSGSAQTFFEAEKAKLVGRNISSLVSIMARKEILQILENYLETSTKKQDYNLRTYVENRIGEIFETEIRVDLYPKLDEELKLVVFFKKLSLPKPIFILNTNGAILNHSKCLTQLFYKRNLFIPLNKDTKLYEICPEFSQINLAFNAIYAGIKQDDVNADSSKHLGIFTKTGEIDLNIPHELFFISSPKIRLLTKTNYDTEGQFFDEGERLPDKWIRPSNTLKGNHFADICNRYIDGSQLRFCSQVEKSQFNKDALFNVRIVPYQSAGEVYKVLIVEEAAEERIVQEIDLTNNESNNSKNTSNESALDFPTEREHQNTDKDITKNQTIPISSTPRAQNLQQGLMIQSAQDKALRLSKVSKIKILDSEPIDKITEVNSLRDIEVKSNQQNASISSQSLGYTQSYKVLEKTLESSDSYSFAKKLTVIITLMMGVLISLAIVNLTASRAAIGEVTNGIQVINIETLQLAEIITGSQTVVRFLIRSLKYSTGTNSLSDLKGLMETTGLEILSLNKKMAEAISAATDKSLVNQVSQKTIEFWSEIDNITTREGVVDIFTASIILANKIMHIGITAVSYSDINALNDVKYVMNNTANDYLLVSEELISYTQTKLEKTISTKLSSLQIILAFETSAIVIVCISLVLAGKIMVDSYRSLFKVLQNVDERHYRGRLDQIQKMKIILDKDADSKGFSRRVLGMLKLSSQDRVKTKETKQRREREGLLIMKSMGLYITRYVGFSLIIIQITTVLYAIALVDSSSGFKSLQETNVQLYTSATAQSQSSRLVVALYMEFGYYNDTSVIIRDQPIKTELTSALHKLSNINAALLSAFSDRQGRITDPVIAAIFSATPCRFLSSAMQTSCLAATAHQNVGLLALNLAQHSIFSQFLQEFFNHPTDLYLKTHANSFIFAQRPIADTIEHIYRFINAHVVSSFELDTSHFLARTGYLHVAIIAVIIITAVLVWMVTIRAFGQLDMSRGKILKVISFRIMLENKVIGLYMRKHFLHKDGTDKTFR